jgi:hypothetical protein
VKRYGKYGRKLTIQLTFLPYFLYLFTIQLAFLPYFPNLFTIEPGGSSIFSISFHYTWKIQKKTVKRYGKYGRNVS